MMPEEVAEVVEIQDRLSKAGYVVFVQNVWEAGPRTLWVVDAIGAKTIREEGWHYAEVYRKILYRARKEHAEAKGIRATEAQLSARVRPRPFDFQELGFERAEDIVNRILSDMREAGSNSISRKGEAS